MDENLSVKMTLDLNTKLTLAQLKAFVRFAELAGQPEDEELPFELDEQDELSGYSVYIDPARVKVD